MPPIPEEVETKMVAGSVGWTRILLMVRPVKQVVPGMPVVTAGLMGPARSAVDSTLLIR